MRKSVLDNSGYNLREPGNGEKLKFLMKYVRDDRTGTSDLLNIIQIFKLFTELCLILLVEDRNSFQSFCENSKKFNKTQVFFRKLYPEKLY